MSILSYATPANGGTIDLTKDMAILNGPLTATYIPPSSDKGKGKSTYAIFNYKLPAGSPGKVFYLVLGSGMYEYISITAPVINVAANKTNTTTFSPFSRGLSSSSIGSGVVYAPSNVRLIFANGQWTVG